MFRFEAELWSDYQSDGSLGITPRSAAGEDLSNAGNSCSRLLYLDVIQQCARCILLLPFAPAWLLCLILVSAKPFWFPYRILWSRQHCWIFVHAETLERWIR